MFYPAYLNLQNRKCLVVGGGIVAERKVMSLLRCGGDITLLSPGETKILDRLARIGRIKGHKRQFQVGDTDGMFLVCAATDNPEINTQVFKDAHEGHGINLVNVVDVIPECTFATASIVTHGDFTISVSTSGKSPAMAKRIREYLEAKFESASLYKRAIDTDLTIPSKNRGLPYPIYFLLENRPCIVINGAKNMSETLAQRVNLLRQCGASVEQIAPTIDNLHHLSDAFLVCIDDIELGENAVSTSDRQTHPGMALDQIQLIEYLKTPGTGTFTTPLLVMDGNLIISISAKDIDPVPRMSIIDWRLRAQNREKQNKAKRIQAELAHQFENKGYGAFIDFLGSLRPLVIEAIPTQQDRQRFFDELIDQIPRPQGNGNTNRAEKCCLGFENGECSMECVFNLIRHGQIDRAHQYALQQISESEKGL